MVVERIVPMNARLLERQSGRFKELISQLDAPNIEEELKHAKDTGKTIQSFEKGKANLKQQSHMYYGLLRDNVLVGAYRIFVNPNGTKIWEKTPDGLELKPMGPYVDSGRMVVHPEFQGKGYSSLMRMHALNEIRRLREKNPTGFPEQYLIVPTGAHRQKISSIYAQHGRRDAIPKHELETAGIWNGLDSPRTESRAILSHVRRLRMEHCGYVKANLGMAFVGKLDDILEQVPTDVRLLKKEATPKGKFPSIKRIALVPGSFDPITLKGHSRVAISAVMDPTLDKVLFMPSADYRTGTKKMDAPADHRLEMARKYVQSLGIPKLELWDKDFQTLKGQPMRRRPLPMHLAWLASEYPGSEIALTVGAHTLCKERGFLNELARDRSWEHLPLRLSFQVAFRGGPENQDELQKNVRTHYERFMQKLSPKQKAKIAGIAFSKIQAVEESSTHVRKLIAGGEPFEELLPDSVAEYVKEQGLYGYRKKGKVQ
ncbi:hypothetical protein HY994_02595 [Candidatus Micrarchaeota archaeon]|nr:hypothetical protein [Candidatus Micrarchaeota archaeon]